MVHNAPPQYTQITGCSTDKVGWMSCIIPGIPADTLPSPSLSRKHIRYKQEKVVLDRWLQSFSNLYKKQIIAKNLGSSFNSGNKLHTANFLTDGSTPAENCCPTEWTWSPVEESESEWREEEKAQKELGWDTYQSRKHN